MTNKLENTGAIYAPVFVTVTDVTEAPDAEPEYVICNEATGRYFLANRSTVHFYTLLKEKGSLQSAIQGSGVPEAAVDGLVKRLIESGLLARVGETQQSSEKPKAPIESKLISMRWDIFDVAGITRRLSGLARFAYSTPGYVLWGIAMLLMAFQLLTHREKALLTMRQVLDASWQQWAILVTLFVMLKIIHELGHATAYREMCRQEGLQPGPIRVGICIFAFTPFPFTDVTGAWRLRHRWRKIMIGAGGIYFETWAMALLTLIWAQTQTGLLQTVILQVAVIAGALTLVFNLNPAVKLDGYFILTDFLRQPNLAARASMAARGFTARLLGADQPKPRLSELGYWLVSYTYRWTIFAGIFWMIYQVDPRLTPVALGIVVMTMIVRPLLNTLRFLRTTNVRPARAAATAVALLTLAAMAFVPFPSRLLVPGQYMTFETRFVEPTETGLLQSHEGGRFVLVNPTLDQQIHDTELQRIMLENLKRASFASAREQASFTAELEANQETLDGLRERRAQLDLQVDAADAKAIWTPLDARWLEQTWVSPSSGNTLGAVSAPVAPYLRLRIDEVLMIRDFGLRAGDVVDARLVIDPTCKIRAMIDSDPASAIALNNQFLLNASVDETSATCVQGMAHGAAIVARLPMGPMSVFDRARLGTARMLQDRLQFEDE